MPINLRHLTADSTWLLTLNSPQNPPAHPPFTILLDPWLDGPSPVWHPKFSVQSHTIPAAISSLHDLDETPNIVIISQDKSDHCNEGTCRQLPRSGVRVYAVPGADKTVRSWKWFQKEEVITLKAWNSRKNGRVEKIPIYGKGRSGRNRGVQWDNSTSYEEDEVVAMVELTYLPALKPWEIPVLHAAVGITYTPIVSDPTLAIFPPSPPSTPPYHDYFRLSPSRPSTSAMSLFSLSGSTLPSSPSLKSKRSPKLTSFFPASAPHSPASTMSSKYSTPPTSPSTSHRSSSHKNPGPKNDLTSSIIYTPHGVPPSALTSYLKTIPLPITLLLHCYDHVETPFWLGGIISSGAPNALKLLEQLKARVLDASFNDVISLQKESYDTPKPPLYKTDPMAHQLGVKYWVSTHDEL